LPTTRLHTAAFALFYYTLQTLKTSLEKGCINATQYAESANTIIVFALQVTAERILGKTEFRSKCAQKEHMIPRGQQDKGHYYSHDKCIAAKQTSMQTLRNKLRQAREEGAPPCKTTDHRLDIPRKGKT